MSDTPTTLRIKLTRSKDYRILTANGASGSIGPNDTLAVDFFIERVASPDSLVYLVQGETAEQQGVVPNERTLEREAQVGFLLTPTVARAIGMWLVTQADNAERARASLQEERETDGIDS